MNRKTRFAAASLVMVTALVFLLFLSTREASATLYCNRPYSQLTLNPGKPYNAVGLLNNGCTAFLIDPNHIVAAAHCFENTTTGEWFTGLRFYPNFHPSRVTADALHVPRADVLRVVVGSRAGESILGSGMDWGIARIGNWQDTDAPGLDLTPVALARSMPAAGTPLSNPAYTRHHFPYNDNDAVTWDNMEWDSAASSCGWVQPNGGMWAIKRRPAPFFNGVNRDKQGCNSRWAAGMIHNNCSLTKIDNGVVVHNCDTIGGSSGSPVMYKNSLGTWQVIGVGHGGGSAATASSNNFGLTQPVCSQDTLANSDNVAASSTRFVDAPRFASNVAVHRSPYSPSATAVFAVDSDLNRVVYRYRQGAAPTYTSKFTYWKNLGAPSLRAGVKLSRIAACSANAAGSPQVFVVAGNQSIYTRSANTLGQWGAWSLFAALDGGVLDLDAAANASGRCMLFMVSNGGGAFVRTRTSDTTWGNWVQVTGGSYKAVTALNYSNKVWAALLDTSGEIWRTTPARVGWTAPVMLSRPAEVSAWRDIDLTWDEAARGFMVAVPSASGPTSKLWFTPLYGDAPWSAWYYFSTSLWARTANVQPSPSLRSITASRWMEDPAGTTTPVIFGTDDRGNVYLIHYSTLRKVWDLKWKSFYHEIVPSP